MESETERPVLRSNSFTKHNGPSEVSLRTSSFTRADAPELSLRTNSATRMENLYDTTGVSSAALLRDSSAECAVTRTGSCSTIDMPLQVARTASSVALDRPELPSRTGSVIHVDNLFELPSRSNSLLGTSSLRTSSTIIEIPGRSAHSALRLEVELPPRSASAPNLVIPATRTASVTRLGRSLLSSAVPQEPIPTQSLDIYQQTLLPTYPNIVRVSSIQELLTAVNRSPKYTPLTVDLGGQELSVESNVAEVALLRSNLTVTNGMLLLPRRARITLDALHLCLDNVTIRRTEEVVTSEDEEIYCLLIPGPHVTLRNCKIEDCVSPGATAVAVLLIEGAALEMDNCEVSDSAIGVYAAENSELFAKGCCFRDSADHNVCVAQQATAVLQDCEVVGGSNGITAVGAKVALHAKGCFMVGATSAVIGATRGAAVILEDCDLVPDEMAQDVVVGRENSTLHIRRSRIKSHGEACIAVVDGAQAFVRESVLENQRGLAASSARKGSRLELQSCRTHAVWGVGVEAGASASIRNCILAGSSELQGTGVLVMHSGSVAIVQGTRLTDHPFGMQVIQGAAIKVDRCSVAGRTVCGMFAAGPRSLLSVQRSTLQGCGVSAVMQAVADLHDCTITAQQGEDADPPSINDPTENPTSLAHHNRGSGVTVSGGASLKARKCHVRGPFPLHAMSVSGEGSEALADGCSFSAAMRMGAFVEHGGSAVLRRCIVAGNGMGAVAASHVHSTLELEGCQVEGAVRRSAAARVVVESFARRRRGQRTEAGRS